MTSQCSNNPIYASTSAHSSGVVGPAPSAHEPPGRRRRWTESCLVKRSLRSSQNRARLVREPSLVLTAVNTSETQATTSPTIVAMSFTLTVIIGIVLLLNSQVPRLELSPNVTNKPRFGSSGSANSTPDTAVSAFSSDRDLMHRV